MSSNIRTFVQACIHCLSTTGGGKVPRPFGPAVHGTKPNDLLQFDYIEIGPSKTGERYILMLRDDHADYKWFCATIDVTAETAASAILDWCAAFGVPGGLMSDGPTHFKNETIGLVTKGLNVPHHFTLPYCPWSNGAVERLGKELIRAFRAVLSELQMQKEELPDLVAMIQSLLDQAPSLQRGGVASVTAFTGLEAQNPVNTFIRSETASVVTVSQAVQERTFNIQKLQQICGELHPLVQESVRSNRERIRQHASSGKPANFSEGNYVLVAREDFHAGENLSLRWRGPLRVKKALNGHVYQVEDLRNVQLDEVHACRLKFYHDKSLDATCIMSHVLSSETGMPVSRLIKLHDSPNGLLVQVRWKGLQSSEDTFEPIEKIHEDVPDLLHKLLLRKSTPAELVAKARQLLSLSKRGM